MIKERLEILKKHSHKVIPPPPSRDFLRFIENAWNDTNESMPTYGQGKKGIFDYYGKDERGSEQARFRIPWGQNKEIEKSYHITRNPEGKIEAIFEGFYPFIK